MFLKYYRFSLIHVNTDLKEYSAKILLNNVKIKLFYSMQTLSGALYQMDKVAAKLVLYYLK